MARVRSPGQEMAVSGCFVRGSWVVWSILFIICSRMHSITHLFGFLWSFILMVLGLNVFRGLVPFTIIIFYEFLFVASWRSSWLGTGFSVRLPTSTPAHDLASSSQHRYLNGVWHEIFLGLLSIPLGQLWFFSVINIHSRILCKFSKKIEAAPKEYSGAWGTLIHEKTWSRKSCVRLSLRKNKLTQTK